MTRFCASAIGLEAYEGLQCEGEKLGQFWLHKVRGDAADFQRLAASVVVMPGLETPAGKISSELSVFFAARASEAEKLPTYSASDVARLRLPESDDAVLNLLRAWRNAFGGSLDISSEF